MSVIRTAVIGFGTAGRVFHAPLIAADPRYSLDAIVTGSPERARAARDTYPETDVLAYTDTLFARADQFDLVVIGSPNESHAPLARAAIEAGAHVVVDKPVAVTSAEARAVAAAAKAAGRVLTVFQNRRWDGDFLTLREVVAAGGLGEVRQFDSAFTWWNPRVGTGWKDLTGPEAGGGILYDLGPHLIDQALQLFGEVTEVHAELDRRRPGGFSDDDSFLTLRHVSGVRTRLWMSAVAPAPRPRFRVGGSRAVFRSDGLDPQEAQSIAGRRPGEAGFGVHEDGRTAVVEGPDGVAAVPLRAGDYREFYRLLAAALREGGPLPVDPADSIRALEIIEQALGGAR
ncbi:Gfo/Idh/MocA family oxidoreductase [Streptomyces sp. NPDC056987]|uniref:Gfo/Idh/MocA family protein n=1 Tax=Streptomyces sp. NPDC056987 TaxID=3345988 RepID=UPI003642174E